MDVLNNLADKTMIDWLLMVGALLLASLIASYIRVKDTPKETLAAIGTVGIVEIFVGCLIAGFMAMWLLVSGGGSVLTYEGFILVGGTAYGGLGAARAALNIVTSTKTEATAS